MLGIEALLVGVCYLLCRGNWQRVALYLLAATAPLEIYRTAIAKVDFSLFRLSLVLAIVLLIANTADKRSAFLRWSRHPLVVAYALLDGVLLLALVVHPIYPFLGEREAAQIGVGVVSLAVFGELVRRESAERAGAAIVAGSALPILAAGWQAIGPRLGAGGGLPLLSKLPAAQGLEITRQALSSFGPIGARAKGTFGDPDHFGVYLIFVTCLALALTIIAVQRSERRAQISFAAMATASVATLAATYSRSAWIGALIGAMITVVGIIRAWRGKKLSLPRRRVLFPVVIAALIVTAVVAPSVIKRAAPSSKINVVSDHEHASTVRFAFDEFVAHPVLGIGPGGLGVKLKLPPRTSGASCTYLSVAAQIGVFGLLILLVAAAIVLRFLIGAYRSLDGRSLQLLTLGFGGAYVGFMAANLTYDVWFDDFHWLMLGAVAGLCAAIRPADPPAELPPGARDTEEQPIHA